MVFMTISCLLDSIISASSPTTELEVWGRLIAYIFGYGAFIGAGLILITLPDKWAEKYMPLYKRDSHPSKSFVGIVWAVVGIVMILLTIWTFMRT
jgi:hypothetical protein